MNLNDEARAEAELTKAIATGSAPTIARTAMAHFWPLYSSHFKLLRSAIEGLPSSELDRYPALRIFHRLTPVLARTWRPYKPLIDPDVARAMNPDELDFVIVAQMIAFRFSGDVAGALIYARRLQDRILRVHIESRERTDGPMWFYHHQIGSTLLAAGDSSSALLEFAAARQLGQLSQQPDAERVVLGRIALAHTVRGSLDDAELALRELESLAPVSPAHATAASATERSAAALIAVDRMSDEMDERLAALDPYDSLELNWPFDLLARTRALLARQRPAEALEAVRLAADSHPQQHGSFASDVICAASIDALRGIDDIEAARALAENPHPVGALTDLASVRLALHESRLDIALFGLRRAERNASIGPGPRAEQQLLIAWLELSRSESLDSATATQIARLSTKSSFRRALTMVPQHVLSRIETGLSHDDASALSEAAAGLTHVEIRQRPSLTTGELRVLNALPSQLTIAEIALEFHLSPNTIKSQLRSVYQKLECSTRDDAVRIAARLGLLGRRTA